MLTAPWGRGGEANPPRWALVAVFMPGPTEVFCVWWSGGQEVSFLINGIVMEQQQEACHRCFLNVLGEGTPPGFVALCVQCAKERATRLLLSELLRPSAGMIHFCTIRAAAARRRLGLSRWSGARPQRPTQRLQLCTSTTSVWNSLP